MSERAPAPRPGSRRGRAVRVAAARDDRGGNLVEYVILAALFALALGLVMMTLDDRVENTFEGTTQDLTTPVQVP